MKIINKILIISISILIILQLSITINTKSSFLKEKENKNLQSKDNKDNPNYIDPENPAAETTSIIKPGFDGGKINAPFVELKAMEMFKSLTKIASDIVADNSKNSNDLLAGRSHCYSLIEDNKEDYTFHFEEFHKNLLDKVKTVTNNDLSVVKLPQWTSSILDPMLNKLNTVKLTIDNGKTEKTCRDMFPLKSKPDLEKINQEIGNYFKGFTTVNFNKIKKEHPFMVGMNDTHRDKIPNKDFFTDLNSVSRTGYMSSEYNKIAKKDDKNQLRQ